MALTQMQLVNAVGDRVGSSRRDAPALTALDEVVLDDLGNVQKVPIGGLVPVTVRVKPARKAARVATPRPVSRSRSPPNRPASACVLAGWRERKAPAVQKARRRVAA